MQTQVSTDDMYSRIKEFEHELKKVYATGHIVKTLQIKKYDKQGAIKGVELLVDNRVSKNQIKQIVSYIKSSYKFDACFYVKPHSIKVWYTDSK